MADYSSPKPIDPIWYQRGSILRIWCGCGRAERYSVGEFARFNRLSDKMLLHEMIKRLRCRDCGERPRLADVVRR